VHHFDVVPTLTDGVVILDAHRPEDLEAHLAGEDDETARRFGWWPERSSRESLARAYDEWAADWLKGAGRRAFAVRAAADQRLVGGCELRLQAGGAAGDVSYWTNADQRRRGFATRALVLLAGFAQSLGVRRLESHVAPDNLASRRVSERAGFVEEGTTTDADGSPQIRYVRRLDC
jgi:RimJ/RimL family protein N-acetyltransferase